MRMRSDMDADVTQRSSWRDARTKLGAELVYGVYASLDACSAQMASSSTSGKQKFQVSSFIQREAKASLISALHRQATAFFVCVANMLPRSRGRTHRRGFWRFRLRFTRPILQP
mmetsp:Transcript_51841/g.116390  ORF Transcript_51841/g.116390 Transcript_51841/m.116390 type:complete len:114 (-) Transcript_51841:305-646(-)